MRKGVHGGVTLQNYHTGNAKALQKGISVQLSK
jgi:hypothetical protein